MTARYYFDDLRHMEPKTGAAWLFLPDAGRHVGPRYDVKALDSRPTYHPEPRDYHPPQTLATLTTNFEPATQFFKHLRHKSRVYESDMSGSRPVP